MFSNRLIALLGIAPMFLAIACSGSPDSSSTTDSSENDLKAKVCGGFAGLTCPSGYSCDFGPGPMHPDQSGHCKKDAAPTCGGIAGLACPDGFECEMPKDFVPDQAGTCKKLATCGGIAGLTCPNGYTCEMPDNFVPDQAGVCKKSAPMPCGGFAGLTCPKGFACDMGPGPMHPDQSGTCVAE